jgi:hypothetical protein
MDSPTTHTRPPTGLIKMDTDNVFNSVLEAVQRAYPLDHAHAIVVENDTVA